MPNELLDDIFEHAYIDSPPTKPLSKRLLHWFEKHLYRKVSIPSFPRCTILLETISAQPYKGHLIAQMNLSALQDPTEDNLDLLATLFSLVANLTHLDCPLLTLLDKRHPGFITLLPQLRSIAISIHTKRMSWGKMFLDVSQLAFLGNLTSLRELVLTNWATYDDKYVAGYGLVMLPRLERLRIEGPGAEDRSVSFLTAQCPALRHLALHSTWTDEIYIFGALENQPSSLESLSLSVENGLVVFHDQQDSLERFTQLQSLHLGDHCYDHDVASTLLKLPLLVDIHLGQGALEPDTFLPLVSGPTRLLFLETITLDAESGSIGKKISPPSKHVFDATRELQRCPIEMLDWRLPEQGEDVTFQGIGLKRLIEVGKENGVTVKGGVLTALQTIEDYHLESNNRDVIHTYFVDLVRSRQARRNSLEDGFPPPSLKFSELEIVEMELPERNWFALDLRSVRK
ncbi:hypothetical protein JCM5353_008648 [Sporobolomyces roseus]